MLSVSKEDQHVAQRSRAAPELRVTAAAAEYSVAPSLEAAAGPSTRRFQGRAWRMRWRPYWLRGTVAAAWDTVRKHR